MKKSFMTRVLATGLSLAMAFSLTAATNVSVASAASTPAMASKQFAVRVGGAAKSYKASAATQKSYKISKATVGNTDKATVKVNSSKKSIKVTPGTVTGSTVVKISFKNIKTKKTTSKKYRCVVKAAVVEKQAIVKAEATGVKTVTLTMAKDVASVASPVAITVKKGTADRGCTATADGKTITLAMEAKLTAGDYTVTIKGLEDTELTKTFNVEKDEYLKTFVIDDKIVAESLTSTTTASIKYSAVNQYGEMMNAGTPTVNCSFGTVAGQAPEKDATATNKGIIKVTGIQQVLAIPGVTGTVVIVDSTGVSATQTVTYTAFAAISEATIVGTYNINTAKIQDITAHEKVADYELLLTAKDRYDEAVDAVDFTKQGVEITVTGGITNIKEKSKKNDWKTRTVDGKDYIAVPLTNSDSRDTAAAAGEANVTIVNGGYGLVLSGKLAVTDAIVIKTASITADNGVYDNEWNTLNYEFIDQNGNAVKSYSVLSKVTGIPTSATSGLRMTRNSDGTAKISLKTQNYVTATDNEKGTNVLACTVGYNPITSGNYFVGTYQFTVRQTRVAKTVTGLKADTVTGVAYTDGSNHNDKNVKIEFKKLILADQYSNKVVDGDDQFQGAFHKGNVTTTGVLTSGAALTVKTNGAFDYDIIDGALVLTPKAVGSATVYLKYRSTKDEADRKATIVSDTSYDYRFEVTAFNTANIGTDNLTVEINGGNQVQVTTDVAITAADLAGKVHVYTTIGGQKTEVPEGYQTVITKIENDKITTKDSVDNGIKSKEATVHVQVTSWDDSLGVNTANLTGKVTISIKDPEVYKLTGTVLNTVTSSGALNTVNKYDKTNFMQNFKAKSQYDNNEAVMFDSTYYSGDTKVTYAIEPLVNAPVDKTQTGYRVHNQGQNSAYIEILAKGSYEFEITATAPNGSTKKYTWKVTAS